MDCDRNLKLLIFSFQKSRLGTFPIKRKNIAWYFSKDHVNVTMKRIDRGLSNTAVKCDVKVLTANFELKSWLDNKRVIYERLDKW